MTTFDRPQEPSEALRTTRQPQGPSPARVFCLSNTLASVGLVQLLEGHGRFLRCSLADETALHTTDTSLHPACCGQMDAPPAVERQTPGLLRMDRHLTYCRQADTPPVADGQTARLACCKCQACCRQTDRHLSWCRWPDTSPAAGTSSGPAPNDLPDKREHPKGHHNGSLLLYFLLPVISNLLISQAALIFSSSHDTSLITLPFISALRPSHHRAPSSDSPAPEGGTSGQPWRRLDGSQPPLAPIGCAGQAGKGGKDARSRHSLSSAPPPSPARRTEAARR